jgi:hypothetical protein
MTKWKPSKEAVEKARQYLEKYGWTIPVSMVHIRSLREAIITAYNWDNKNGTD